MNNLIVLLLLLAASAGQTATQTPGAVQPQPSVAPLGFQIGPGDVLDVSVWTGNETENRVLTVAADGTILVPWYVNKKINVNGMTSVRVAALIEEEMKRNYRDPRVQVIQTRIESKKTLLGGDVFHPGAYPITGDTTLLDLIIGSGGFTANANLAEVKITRSTKGRQLTVNVLDTLIGLTTTNPVLEPGDIVFVPSVQSVSNKVFVVAEGRSASLLQTAEKVTLLDAITRSSVVSANVRLGRVLVIRFNPKDLTTEAKEIQFDDIYKKADLSVNIPLENGDIVFLPRGGMGRLNDVLTSINPLITFVRDTVFLGQVFKRNP